MAEEVKDEEVEAGAREGVEARGADVKRSIFKPQSLPESIYLQQSLPIQEGTTPVFIAGPHKLYPKLKQELSPMTMLERDVPWKLVFMLYAFLAVGGLVLFGVFLVTMIRIYKQQVY